MAHPVDPEFLALQSALAGQYFLERELGRGGMGIVYLAREVQLDRPVAVKVLPPALAVRPDLRERFLREARTSAKLSHPNIVPIFRADEVGGFVFFAMAYVDGETLTQRVRAKGPLNPREASRILREVAWALAYAHARGIVHRDVKPDNILLEREGGRALVTDFGIAHLSAASSLTDVGVVMGTAHYMSPEQAAGEQVDGRSDLYSLGVVAYFALTGRLPFDAPTAQAVLAQHLTQQPPPLAATAPHVPRQLAESLTKCLAKDPAQRFQSGEQLADAIALASERKVEIPAPLRVWIQKGHAFRVVAVVSTMFGIPQLVEGQVVDGLLWFTGPFALYALFRLQHTRKVLAAGYGLEDILAGLRMHFDQRREELEFEHGREPSMVAKAIRALSYLSLAGLAAFSLATAVLGADLGGRISLSLWGQIFAALAVTPFLGAIIGMRLPGRRIGPNERGEKLWLRLWEGKFGRVFTSLASYKLARRAPAAVASRPTEVAIGMAAADLYGALPKGLREQLKDVPEVVRTLEAEAQAGRKRMDELATRLAALEAGDVGSRSATLGGDAAVDAQRRGLVDDLRAARDAAAKKQAAAVAALESIRLDLLRLQAGAGSVASVTAALASARRIGDQVDAAVAGRRDVEDDHQDSPPEGAAAVARTPG